MRACMQVHSEIRREAKSRAPGGRKVEMMITVTLRGEARIISQRQTKASRRRSRAQKSFKRIMITIQKETHSEQKAKAAKIRTARFKVLKDSTRGICWVRSVTLPATMCLLVQNIVVHGHMHK
jgi:hypothetical protein